ncbi:hypothetical protein LVQ76_09005 [Buttiauxella sp. W03-F01]|nr:hypothetical protein [Buttiauxella sp. S04-F03]MCE0812475.1 hypothetical protein [Buttiauxella sp. S04-F03]
MNNDLLTRTNFERINAIANNKNAKWQIIANIKNKYPILFLFSNIRKDAYKAMNIPNPNLKPKIIVNNGTVERTKSESKK